LTYYPTSNYFLIMELCFGAILRSYLGYENSDAGHIKCSQGLRLAPGLQIPHPWFTL